MKLRIDHVAIWTTERDALLHRIARATGLEVLDGWRPEGKLVSRGVRFANGPFLDVHQVEDTPGPAGIRHALLGLGGGFQAATDLADRRGWRVALAPFDAGKPRAEPWSMVSFRRGQGLMSLMFVIDYEPEGPAWAQEEFGGPLFRPAASRGTGSSVQAIGLEHGPGPGLPERFLEDDFSSSRGDLVPVTGWNERIAYITVRGLNEKIDLGSGVEIRPV
ncbi:MAG: hypothetical protein U1E50_14805 [Caulobacteraceae bacterium]